MLTTATATVSPPPRYRTTASRRGTSVRRPSNASSTSSLPHSAAHDTLRRLGLPLGFPLPPLTVPRRPSGLASPPMSPSNTDSVQTKSVEYYRAAPAAPGSHSIDLERVHPPMVRPTRSPSDPPAIAPLTIQKRVRSPPAAIVVPPLLDPTRPQIARSRATPTGYFDPQVSPAASFATANSHGPHATPKDIQLSLPPTKRGPAPGPPPLGPLPPLPDQGAAFSEGDPLMIRAASAREKREARRQSKTPDDKEIAALERSMRRLSRISLGPGASPTEMGERASGAASPTISLAGSLGGHSVGRAERTEKLLRRISRMSDGIRLPTDYGRVGISGFLVPSSAPVSPGLRGFPPALKEHHGEYESSELAYLHEPQSERPSPALSVPMRRNIDQAQSAPGLYAASIPEMNNGLGLGLGLGLTTSDSQSSTMASTSMASLPSITSISTLPSDPTLSTLPSDATMITLPSESTIRPKLAETRPSRLGSLSSASSTAASIRSSNTFESTSTTSLLTPISPPIVPSALPSIQRSPMSPPRQLRLKPSLAKLRLPPPTTALPPIPAPPPSLLARPSSPDISSILAQYDGATVASRNNQSLTVDASVPPTRVRPGARPRVHSDLSTRPPMPPKDELVGPKGERLDDEPNSTRSSTDSRVAVEDSRSGEDNNVLEVPPTRPSLESQTTPRVASRTPTPQPQAAAAAEPSRPASPDISYILRTTPRPTRRSSAYSLASSVATSRRPSGRAPPSSFRPTPSMSSCSAGPSRRGSDLSLASSRQSSSSVTASSAGLDLEGAGPEVFFGDQYDSEDSDSDLDLSTPLPHMMLRAGLLSPRSTIITEALEAPPPQRESRQSALSARGEALRLKGEKVWKAESKRKVRHRDGRNLRDGVGLTTGLGWSDSEDEDAPSPLRRRLSNVLLAKAQSRPPSQLSRHSTTFTLSRQSTYSNLDSTSVSSQSLPRTPSSHPLSLPLTPSSLPGGATGGTDEFGKLDFPMPPTATSWRGLPSPGLRRPPSNTMLRSASSAVGSSKTSSVPAPVATASLRSRTLSAASSAATHSTSSAASPRSSIPRQSMMPTPRPARINVRPPTATRLSAPEALRAAEGLVADGSRRLSGV